MGKDANGILPMASDKALQYHGAFPLAITPLAAGEDCVVPVADNQATIALLDLLETGPQLPRESERRDPIMQELRRLDHKLDLVLAMLARQQADAAPALRNRLLRREGLAWRGRLTCAVGDRVRVAMYPEPACPQALILCARVRACDAEGGELVFEQVDADTDDWLTRFLFRHHRREVAEARSRQGGQGAR